MSKRFGVFALLAVSAAAVLPASAFAEDIHRDDHRAAFENRDNRPEQRDTRIEQRDARPDQHFENRPIQFDRRDRERVRVIYATPYDSCR